MPLTFKCEQLFAFSFGIVGIPNTFGTSLCNAATENGYPISRCLSFNRYLARKITPQNYRDIRPKRDRRET